MLKTTARNYNKYDPVILSRDLETTDWSPVYRATDANVACDTFVSIFENLLNFHAPWKEVLVPINSLEWLIHEFVSECKARDHFNIFAKWTKQPEHIRQAKINRNRVNQIAKNTKKDLFHSKN